LSPGAAPAVSVEGVHAAYGRIEVLHGVDLHVPGGSVFALLGPNGAGKTTLLKVLNGRLHTTAGAVSIEGVKASPWSPDRLARAGVIAIPEGRGVFPNLTVRDNLRMWTYRGVTAAEVEEHAYAQFPRLKERRKQLAGTLSGGEQQMLAIARGLMAQPKLLLLDEPSLGLAPKIVDEVFEKIQDIRRTGVTMLIVEQNVVSGLSMSDRGYVVQHGSVVLADTANNLLSNETVRAAYLGL